jgi:hypothetical protein
VATPAFSIEPADSINTGRCECCGNFSRCVWGYGWLGRTPFANYFVHWTLGHVPEHGANFDLIAGKWGDGTTASDRWAASLVYRLIENGPSFMVIDADRRNFSKSPLVGRALQRADVVGNPIAQDIYALCDAILMQDRRLDELLGGRTLSG